MELLAPAGSWESFIAAINNGADAVYLGGQQFSARQSAANFNDQQIEEALEYAHLRDKKVYAAVNTLIDNSEFSQVLDYLYKLQQIGIDAVILQDIGLLQAARTVLPGLQLHASTQMTIHNQDGAAWLHEQGIKRIVLARELAVPEMAAINKAVPEVELEVFVHGALCFCYSGQCLFSSMVGGRSGNRGRCAQPCRLPYDLYTNRVQQKMLLNNQGKYLLSPADLCLIENLPTLAAAGVSSLKIEGRMKRPEYVAVVTRAYRQTLDALQNNPHFIPGPEIKDRLLRIFNRNFTGGHAVPGREEFLSTKRPNNRGVFVGRIIEQTATKLTRIKLNDSVKVGDGLVVWVGQGQSPALIVREMRKEGHSVAEAYPGDIIEVHLDGRVFAHDRVFKTHDEELLASARKTITELNRIPVDMDIYLEAQQPMRLIMTDQKGRWVEVQTRSLAQPAEQHPLNKDILEDKLGRLGNTPFVLGDLTIHGERNLIIPFSDINDARRQAVEMLKTKIVAEKHHQSVDYNNYWTTKDNFLSESISRQKPEAVLLAVAVSTPEQAVSALQQGADRVYLGLEGLSTHHHLHKQQLSNLLEVCGNHSGVIIPMMPRIHKPGDKYSYREVVEENSPNVMISGWGDLAWARSRGLNVWADYTLNVFNTPGLKYLLKQGLRGVCLSPELNLNQLAEFKDLSYCELIVHGEIIVMESEYCMLGGVIGNGPAQCQAPCTADSYFIKDSKGFEFPVETDADCRFYVFNSRTLNMAEDVAKILPLQPASIRIEARRLSVEKLASTINVYRSALDKLNLGIKPDWWAYQQELNRASNSAFTKGHYYRGVLI